MLRRQAGGARARAAAEWGRRLRWPGALLLVMQGAIWTHGGNGGPWARLSARSGQSPRTHLVARAVTLLDPKSLLAAFCACSMAATLHRIGSALLAVSSGGWSDCKRLSSQWMVSCEAYCDCQEVIGPPALERRRCLGLPATPLAGCSHSPFMPLHLFQWHGSDYDIIDSRFSQQCSAIPATNQRASPAAASSPAAVPTGSLVHRSIGSSTASPSPPPRRHGRLLLAALPRHAHHRWASAHRGGSR